MRNLYITNSPASYRVDLYNALYSRFSCEVFFFADVPADSCMNEQEMQERFAFPPRHLEIRSLRGLKWGRGIGALLKLYTPEYVFVPEFSLLALQFLRYRKRYGFRLVSFCDDSVDMISGNDYSRFHRLARKVLPKYLDQVVVTSRPVQQWYLSHFGKGLCFPIIVDDERLRERLVLALPHAEEIRSRYCLEKKKLVLFVGRLVGLKNVPRLIDAVARLEDKDVRLVIIGNGVEATALKQKASLLGLDVLFPGEQYGEDLLAWYQLADVHVIPSIQEAYGAVTGEALTAGCPVLVSRLAGSSALVIDGENGAVFDPFSVEELRALLERFLRRTVAGRPLQMRPSLLPVRFKDCFDQLVNGL